MHGPLVLPASVFDVACDAAMPRPNLDAVHQSIGRAAEPVRCWTKPLAFTGSGYLIAVGYMDPGNWATDIAAGSAFGHGRGEW